MATTNLNGSWRLIRSVVAGKEEASPTDTQLYIEGEVFERRTPDYTFKRKITLDDSVIPHHINLHITNEPQAGLTFLGIYHLQQDTLTIAHAQPGKPRPTSFESTPENQQVLSVSVRMS